MHILAFAASSSQNSINRQLIHYIGGMIDTEGTYEMQYLDLNDFDMPLYSIDRQNELGILEPAQRFYQLIGAASGVMVSFAEHNGNFTAAYKNRFDWT
jgi:chromate reductase, NAD(P)H dehydrogenase (quinone)